MFEFILIFFLFVAGFLVLYLAFIALVMGSKEKHYSINKYKRKKKD